MTKLEGGYINQVFRDGDKVVKHYATIPTVYVPLDVRYGNEKHALTRHGGAIAPRLYHADDAAHVITMEYLQGDSMKHSIDNGLGTPEKAQLFEGFGHMLHKLHTHIVPGSIEEYVTKMDRKAWEDLDIFRRSGVAKQFGIDEDDIARMLHGFVLPEMTKTASKRQALSYTHGDIWSNNVIDLKAIDWEFSIPGLPEEDLVQVYMWDIARFPQFQKDFEKGYGLVPDLRAFQVLKLLDYMEGASQEQVAQEDSNGFITVHAKALKGII